MIEYKFFREENTQQWIFVVMLDGNTIDIHEGDLVTLATAMLKRALRKSFWVVDR